MASNLDRTWTPELVETLKALWFMGDSASEIARTLKGGLTRNAVIGKIHRLGLSQRRVPKLPPEGRPARAPRVARQTYAKPPKPGPQNRPAVVFGNLPSRTSDRARTYVTPEGRRLPAEAVPAGPVVALADLTPGACRWPIGDPAHPSFGFCGRQAIDPCPYCEGHRRMAYQAPKDIDKEDARLIARFAA